MYGRVLSASPLKFNSLIDEEDYPDRRIVFLMDETALNKLKDLKGLSILKAIGWTDRDIKSKLNRGKQFKLITIPETEINAVPATWDNLMDIVISRYPEISEKIKENRLKLKEYSYDQIFTAAGFDSEKIDKNDPRFMSLERFRRSRGNLTQARSFLLHTLNINSLFKGDGKTSGGLNEYIAANRYLNEIRNYTITDII